jgi:hypothetical protein
LRCWERARFLFPPSENLIVIINELDFDQQREEGLKILRECGVLK